MTKPAAVYARISVEDENVPKTEHQVAACRALAGEHGYTVEDAHVYVDNGIPATGKSIREGTRDKRADFDRLLTAAEAGEFSAIVVVAGDRLARNYPDGLDIVDACVAGDVVILSDDDGVIDPRTPAGEEQAMSLFTGGRKEIRARSNKQRRRYAAERVQGMPLWGRRPFGFEWVEESNRHGKISRRPLALNELEADAIRWAVEYFLKPEGTVYGVVREWQGRGLKTTAAGYARRKPVAGNIEFSGDWTNQSVRGVLSNPRNAGLVVENGEILRGEDGTPVPAAWPAIVSVDDWRAVVDKLSDPSRRTNAGRKPSSLASGLVFCACGLPMRATTIKGKPLGEPDSPPVKLSGLRCDVNRNQSRKRQSVARHVSMRDDVLNPLLSREVARAFLFGPSSLIPDETADLKHLDIEAAELREEEGRAALLVFAGGVAGNLATKRISEIHTRLDQIDATRREAVSKSAQAAMLVDLRAGLWSGDRVSIDDAGAAHTALRERFDALPLHQRRELVKTLLYVEILPGQGVKIDPERRVIILHRVVRSLNDEAENAYLDSLS